MSKPPLGSLVKSFQLSKDSIDVSSINPGSNLNLISLTVDTCGVVGQTVWRAPSGGGQLDMDQDCIGSVIGDDSYGLNKYAVNGRWTLDKAYIDGYEYDKSEFDDYGFHTHFNVTGGLNDDDSPEIISLDYSDNIIDVSNLKNNERVEFSFTIMLKDDLSGVHSVYAEWDSPGKDQDIISMYTSEDGKLISGNENYGTFEGSDSDELNRSSEPGVWTIKRFSVQDKMDNSMAYDMYDLKEMGLPYSFEVINDRISSVQLPGGQSSINNVTNITNNTEININDSGSGNVITGDIGSVNNTTTIDNSFTIQTTNIDLSVAITGDSKKSEKVEGTDGDDLIADGLGKDKLIGGEGADQFYFSGEEPFKKRTVDKIIDFDASEGDAIVIAGEVISDLDDGPSLAIADTRKDLKQLSKDGYDLLYFEPKGDLYVDGNGGSKGFGQKSEGGMIADLPNKTTLTESDVLIGM